MFQVTLPSVPTPVCLILVGALFIVVPLLPKIGLGIWNILSGLLDVGMETLHAGKYFWVMIGGLFIDGGIGYWVNSAIYYSDRMRVMPTDAWIGMVMASGLFLFVAFIMVCYAAEYGGKRRTEALRKAAET